MNRQEAEALCERLSREHPDRRRYRWFPQRDEGEGTWRVAKAKLPEGLERDPMKATTEAKPKPAQPDDPRSILSRNAPGTWGT
jgi:hypothetical protein